MLSTTTPPIRWILPAGTSASQLESRGPRSDASTPPDGGRGLLQHRLRRRHERSTVGQLVGRVLPEDDDAGHAVGPRRQDRGRSSGMSDVPTVKRHRPVRLPRRLEHQIHHRSHQAGRLLPAGEEYSAQIDSFIRAAAASLAGATLPTVNDFRSGLATDRAIAMIIDDAAERKAPSPALSAAGKPRMKTSERRRFRWGWRRRA